MQEYSYDNLRPFGNQSVLVQYTVKVQTYLALVDGLNSPSLNTAAMVNRYQLFAISNYHVSSSYNSVNLLPAKAAHWNSSIELASRKDGTAAACRESNRAQHAIETAHSKVLCLGDYSGDCNFHYSTVHNHYSCSVVHCLFSNK